MNRRLITIILAATMSAAAFAGNPVIKFGIVADIQYDPVAQHPSGTRHYSDGVRRFSEAVKTFNGIDDLAFVASLGDMTDRNPFCYADLKAVSDQLKAPLHNVMGNHDMAPLKSAEDIARARALKGLENPYYSFVKGNVRFVVLDCLDFSPIAHPEGSKRQKASEQWHQDMVDTGAVNNYDWNGGIGLEQLVWLDSELKKADRKGQYAIIMCHMPLYPFDLSASLWNSMEVTHLLESHPSVKAVLCGHHHLGGYEIRNGIHHVIFMGMVEGEANRYAVVTLDTAAGRLTIDGYGDEKKRVLELK